MTDHEEWRPAPGIPWYEVSSLGRVRSLGTSRTAPGILTGTTSRTGYVRLNPYAKGQVSLHRLVCEAFHGPAPEGCRLVRHLDDDKQNNRAENLAWGTDMDNYRDGVRNGVMPGLPPRKRLFTNEQVVAMRERHAAGQSVHSMAKEAGVSHQSLRLIINGEHYRDATPRQPVQ